MTYDFQQPTPAEIHAHELKAHQLRAQAMRSGGQAIASFVKSVAQRALEAFTRPAHA